jgi:hypothetical protein
MTLVRVQFLLSAFCFLLAALYLLPLTPDVSGRVSVESVWCIGFIGFMVVSTGLVVVVVSVGVVGVDG